MSNPVDDMVGFGAALDVPVDVQTDKLWQALLVKIRQPELFLPVTDVVWRDLEGGKIIYREMTIHGKKMIEDISYDESIHEVVFKVTNNDEFEEHVNVIHIDEETGTRSLEFYRRNSETKERTHWNVPKTVAFGGISKVIELGRTL